MQNYAEWLCSNDLPMSAVFNEVSSDASRYSVEINFRSSLDEVLDGFAKLVLSYVSAGIKREGYHVKHVFSEKPYRLLISTRQWEDGEWVTVVTFHENDKSFYLSKGFWNRERKTVSIQNTQKINEKNAADIVHSLTSELFKLKSEKPRLINKLKPAPQRRGPKR